MLELPRLLLELLLRLLLPEPPPRLLLLELPLRLLPLLLLLPPPPRLPCAAAVNTETRVTPHSRQAARAMDPSVLFRSSVFMPTSMRWLGRVYYCLRSTGNAD